MSDSTFEVVMIATAVIIVSLSVVTFLVAALFFGSQPNHTAIACIEAGMELIDGNCLTP